MGVHRQFPRGHIQNVAVFCGSREGDHPVYMRQAFFLGRGLAKRGIHVVYGSGNKALMGAVKLGVESVHGHITGINLHMFAETEGNTAKYPRMREEFVGTMMNRKGRMMELVDAYIVLPGGLGTLDEIGDALVENDLMPRLNPGGIIKPVIFIDTLTPEGKRYFELLLNFIDSVQERKFSNTTIRRFYDGVPTVRAGLQLVDQLQNQGPVPCRSTYKGLILPPDCLAEIRKGFIPQMPRPPAFDQDTANYINGMLCGLA